MPSLSLDVKLRMVQAARAIGLWPMCVLTRQAKASFGKGADVHERAAQGVLKPSST